MKTFNPNVVIGKGEVVSFKGKSYEALRTSKGREPCHDLYYWACTEAEEVTPKNNEGTPYMAGRMYKAGSIVKHKNEIYRAKLPTDKNPEIAGKYWEVLHTLDKPVTIQRDNTPDVVINLPFDDTPYKPIVLGKNLTPAVIIREQIIGRQGDPGKDGLSIKGDPGLDGADGQDGKDGIDGLNGIGLQFKWDDTKLGVKREDETEYQFVELSKPSTGFFGSGGASQKFNLSGVGTGKNLVYTNIKGRAAELKSIKAGTNITITDNNQGTLTIASTGGGGGGGSVPLSNFAVIC